ncbi:MAG: SPOR domain-containing protein, partial [Pseudomonadota bacterium]
EIRDAGETTETDDRAAVETPIEIQAPPVPQAEPPADGPRRHRVQLAAYGRDSLAREGWASIQAAHPAILGDIEPNFVPFEDGVRLQVGNFERRGAALDLCRQLDAAGRACFVTSATALPAN